MGFLYSQLFASLPYPTGSYAGKTIIITGSNTGLGKEAARHYVRLDASRVILAVRSVEKGVAAKQDIEASTKGTADIQVWHLDMGSYASVQDFAKRVDAELDRVDVFLANAGVAKANYAVVEDNEETITINVVSTFLLAALLMPKLKATASQFNTRPNLTITSSGAHAFSKFEQKSAPAGQLFATINDEAIAKQYWDTHYPLSKMIEIFAVRSIGAHFPASTCRVTINCVDPGLCHSELAREHPTWTFWLMKLLLARSTECGSRTLVHAAAQGAETHGMYLSDCHVADPAPLVTSEEGQAVQKRLWEELVGKLEGIREGVTGNF